MQRMKKKAKGRPPKRFGLKAEQIVVRVTPKTKEVYERAALIAEMDFSDWVRFVLDNESRRQIESATGSAAGG